MAACRPGCGRNSGPEAHLAVTTQPGSGSVFAMAARAGRENEIAAAVCRRATLAAQTRLSGRHPGILAIFLDDLDRLDWRALRGEQLELEGAVRRFLTTPPARQVVAVSCTSRFEMFGGPDAAPEGELRFRNPSHAAAKHPGLAPAILSSMRSSARRVAQRNRRVSATFFRSFDCTLPSQPNRETRVA